ncbi:hypothetical protein P691DRAFT_695906 [Macrolepiota fuliginosa MF-IS2]|uniref:Secreted protein n=1 Tax=Macrolepiota fuliginosa MF-IS2 TaxID=1400762 RepID=A0A9P6C5W3_9AGAR|nr:hypothetical protein P691DRAFT_695906 [Macrolepiota fuliginosa MF-IS2]
MLRGAVTIVALAGLASAQVSGISSQCTGALASIVTNTDANACLSPQSFLPLATSTNTSVVGPINDWATNVCSAAPCSNQTLATVVSQIVAGCQNEISGGTSNEDPTTLANSITPLVQQYYPTVRKVVCLKDGNTNCLTETLTSIENTTGPLTISSLLSMIMGGPQTLQNVPSNVTCSNCIKAAYNIINTDIPTLVSDAAPALQSQCGASFTDGNTPSSISQSASDAAASGSSNTQNSGATTILMSGFVVSALTLISSAVILL